MTYHDIKHNAEVNELLKKGNQNLGLLGFTDHSQAHCIHVAETAAHILKKFDYSAHDIELAKIAGYLPAAGAVQRQRQAPRQPPQRPGLFFSSLLFSFLYLGALRHQPATL